jgi:hypothetical protein
MTTGSSTAETTDPRTITSSASDVDGLKPAITRLSITQSFPGEKLDRQKSNWKAWSRQIRIYLSLNGLDEYVNGTLEQPPIATEPRAHVNWQRNDHLAYNYLLQNVDENEQEYIESQESGKACWATLEARHINEGPIRQLQLLTQALSTKCSHDTPLPPLSPLSVHL